MKIIIIANDPGGLYNFRRELISTLKNKYEVIVITPVGELIQELSKLGVKIIQVPIDRRGKNLFRDLKLIIRYFCILRREHPNYVITYTIKPNLYGGLLCRFLKIPYAANITGLGSVFQTDGIFRKIINNFYKVSLKKSKAVFFENEENMNLFIKQRLVKKNQTHLLMGAGVNLQHFQLLAYPSGNIFKFLFVGRIMREKGIEELLEATRKLVNGDVKIELHILGYMEENYSNLIYKYQEEGWLFYHGVVKDVRPYIKNTHCFVLPSWHEGMANTNLECAASGRPLITTNIPGCREAVIENKTGLLCKPRDPESLYNAMYKMINIPENDRKYMGELGRKHMKDVFDKRKIIDETITLLFGC